MDKNKYRKYLDAFEKYARKIYDEYPPRPNSSSGLAESLKSYLNSLSIQLGKINDKLTAEADRIVQEASVDKSINREALTKELLAIVRRLHNDWINKYNPK